MKGDSSGAVAQGDAVGKGLAQGGGALSEAAPKAVSVKAGAGPAAGTAAVAQYEALVQKTQDAFWKRMAEQCDVGGRRRAAREAAKTQAVGQQVVDTKALTGRGAQRRLRDARANVDLIHGKQAQLVDYSLQVVGHAVRLCLHKRPQTEQQSLRWRESHGRRAHVGWDDVLQRIASYPTELRTWYVQANVLAQKLNREEQEARAALRKARDELLSLQGELKQLI